MHAIAQIDKHRTAGRVVTFGERIAVIEGVFQVRTERPALREQHLGAQTDEQVAAVGDWAAAGRSDIGARTGLQQIEAEREMPEAARAAEARSLPRAAFQPAVGAQILRILQARPQTR